MNKKIFHEKKVVYKINEKSNRPGKAKVGATVMAQNTDKKMTLMFRKLYFCIFFGIKCNKTMLMLGIAPATCRFLRFYKGVFRKKF